MYSFNKYLKIRSFQSNVLCKCTKVVHLLYNRLLEKSGGCEKKRRHSIDYSKIKIGYSGNNY